MKFIDKLGAIQRNTRSNICVGLDPDLAKLPPILGRDPAGILAFCTAIIDSTADLVCAFKPNLAFFLSGANIDILREVIAHVPPHIPTILDAKFGDIGSTTAHYATFAFDILGADAVTVSPYIGTDAVRPFLAHAEKFAFVLARTSNTAGNEFQAGQPPLYQQITARMVTLAGEFPGQIGLVVGATQPKEIAAIRAQAPTLPFLIPGIGAQGGDLEAVLRAGTTQDGIGPVINLSRVVLYASSGADFAEAARTQVITVKNQIAEGR